MRKAPSLLSFSTESCSSLGCGMVRSLMFNAPWQFTKQNECGSKTETKIWININNWFIRSTQISAPSPHQWDRQHGREMGGSAAWNRLAAGTSADTWRTPGHPAGCWSLSWRTSVEWIERKLDQKSVVSNTITVIAHVGNLVNLLK